MTTSILRRIVAVEWGEFATAGKLRLSVLCAVMMLYCVATDHYALTAPLSLSVVWVAGIADPGGAYRHRAGSLLAATCALSISVWIAGLVADTALLRILVMTLVAVVCGFIGCLGARAGLVGVLTVVAFAVFSGVEFSQHQAAVNGIAMFLGSLIGLVVVMGPWVVRRAGGQRGEIAHIYRGLARAARRRDFSAVLTTHTRRVRSVTIGIDVDQHEGAAAAWLADLARVGDDARRGLEAMLAERMTITDPHQRVALDVVVDAFGAVSVAIARAMVWSHRRATVRVRMSELQVAAQQFTQTRGMEDIAPLLDALVRPIDEAAQAVTAPWPLGGSNGIRLPSIRRPVLTEIRRHLHPSDLFVRHAVRLGIAIAIADIIGEAVLQRAPWWHQLGHGFWIPMTVAWISKPGQGDTVQRVTLRVTGTIVGVIASSLLFWLWMPPNWVIALLLGAMVFVIVAFVAANYAIAIAGMTSLVMLLSAFVRTQSIALECERIAATLVAGVIVLGVALLWPERVSTEVCDDIEDVLTRLAEFVAEVCDVHADRDAVDRSRDAVAIALDVAIQATKSAAFEPTRHRLHTDDARAILAEIEHFYGHVIAIEMMCGVAPEHAVVLEQSHKELELLRTELHAVVGKARRAHREQPVQIELSHPALSRTHALLRHYAYGVT